MSSLGTVCFSIQRLLCTARWVHLSKQKGYYGLTRKGTAAGTKVGGSFASWEFDGVSWGRWLPMDERKVLTAKYEERTAVQCAPNWMFGDAGSLYLLICRACEQWPITALMQSS